MKTNQVLTRKMGDFDVLQRTSDGYFDANALLAQWNSISSHTERKMARFLEASSTKEFIETIIEKEIDTTDNQHSAKSDNGDYQAVIKSKGRHSKEGRTPDKVWMHPFLFIDFAMWINPKFKYEVIKFVYDQLIQYRNDAGDAYKEMAKAIAVIVEKSFMQAAMQFIAQALNHVVYGEHISGMRNKQAEEAKVKELYELERDIAKLINNGYVTSFEQLKSHLRKEWRNKWQPKVLDI